MDSEPQQLNAISYTLFIGHSRRIHVGCEALFKKAQERPEKEGENLGEPGEQTILVSKCPAHLPICTKL